MARQKQRRNEIKGKKQGWEIRENRYEIAAGSLRRAWCTEDSAQSILSFGRTWGERERKQSIYRDGANVGFPALFRDIVDYPRKFF